MNTDDKSKDDVDTTTSDQAMPEAKAASSATSDLKQKFTKQGGDNPYSTTFLAGKKSKETGVFETEEECKARLDKDFDISGTECTWSAERNGFVAAGNKGKKKTIEAKNEKGQTAGEALDETQADHPDAKVVVEEPDLPPKAAKPKKKSAKASPKDKSTDDSEDDSASPSKKEDEDKS
jgi:hypothetical protein